MISSTVGLAIGLDRGRSPDRQHPDGAVTWGPSDAERGRGACGAQRRSTWTAPVHRLGGPDLLSEPECVRHTP